MKKASKVVTILVFIFLYVPMLVLMTPSLTMVEKGTSTAILTGAPAGSVELLTISL